MRVFAIFPLCAAAVAVVVSVSSRRLPSLDPLLLLLSSHAAGVLAFAFQNPRAHPVRRHPIIRRNNHNLLFAAKGSSKSNNNQLSSRSSTTSTSKNTINKNKRKSTADAKKKKSTSKKGVNNKKDKRRKSSKGKVAQKNTSPTADNDHDSSSSTNDANKVARPTQTQRNQAATTLSKNNNSNNKQYIIQFSRVFQRHVVIDQTKDDDEEDEVIILQSFQFLDDAIANFPLARVLAPKDVPFPPPMCTIDWTVSDSSSSASSISSSESSSRSLGGYNKETEECESTIAGMGLMGLCDLEYDDDDNIRNQDGKCPPSTQQSSGDDDGQCYEHYESNEALRTLLQLVSSTSSAMVPRHFFRLDHRRFALGGHTSQSITINHARVVNLLSCGGHSSSNNNDANDDKIGLAMTPSELEFVLSNFPQVCLYDSGELEIFILFLLSPMPPSTIPSVTLVADTGVGGEKVDWPRLAHEGYGAGLTKEQATKAIRMMPELMALYYEDTRKPSVGYMYTQMQQRLPPQLSDEVQMQLGQFLEGADFSDVLTLGYLHSLGISWKKLRLLLSAFPLWTTNNLDPGWEILQRGPVRSVLKRHSLDYLRQRLQIRPSEVYKMLKTHTRLSTYSAATKILPTLDKLQRRLDLQSSELKQLILRMPSVIGIGTSAKKDISSSFDQRIEFFQNEAGMSIKEIKESVLKQPSLIQYGIATSLRPKLDFFLNELGIPHKYIGRIVSTSSAVMGLSLPDTLRPKVASIMKLCALHPYEVGMMVVISPQTLFLSQKGKIEPALHYLASALSIDEPRDLGELVLKAPRLLRQGLETSLMKKIDLIADALSYTNEKESKLAAAEILRQNPALFDTSNAVIIERLQRCVLADKDVPQYLLPSQKGRRKLFSFAEEVAVTAPGDPILMSSDETFNSISKIYPDAASAAGEMGLKKKDISRACKNGLPIDGHYFSKLMDSWRTKSKSQSLITPKAANTVNISMYCSGGSYPSDSVDVTRGQSTTGGIALQIVSEGVDTTRLLFEISNASNKCFGIRVPLGKEPSGDKLLAVFPLMNPGRNRCHLYSCSSALRVLEIFLNTKRKDKQHFYDITVYTDSTYAWKLVRDRQRLMSLGSCFHTHQMLSKLDVTDGSSYNIDIFHPLTRSFSRLNGQEEPPESTGNHRPFYNSSIKFYHSFDGVLEPGEIKTLEKLAKSAAMWQFNRERSFVPK